MLIFDEKRLNIFTKTVIFLLAVLNIGVPSSVWAAVNPASLELIDSSNFDFAHNGGYTDRRTRNITDRYILTHVGDETLEGPFILEIVITPNDVSSVLNADDVTTTGHALINLNQTTFSPGESINYDLIFSNPGRQRFTYVQNIYHPVSTGPTNTPPVADAGPDQIAFVAYTVTLDGSASSDVDGDSLDFTWSLINLPVGSTATLSDPNSISPTFIIDFPGTYEVQLIVNDGLVDSPPDTVIITTENTTPVANAGPDQTVPLNSSTVTLNGNASSDVDGDILAFAWEITAAPVGSNAVLSDSTAVNPTLVIDVAGDYTIQLIVNDGTEDSAPDTIMITTANTAPVADAGLDQSVLVGDTVTLDGSSSVDVDGDFLNFLWSFISVPVGSNATLSDPALVNPVLEIDQPGAYVLQLIVNDGTENSAPDTVSIVTTNSQPIANAGADQTVLVGETVQLDGSSSSDVDGDLLDFYWSFTSAPDGSGAVLSDATAVMPTFTVDLPGTYVAQLIVSDAVGDSDPDTVMIVTVNSPPVADAGPDQTAFVTSTVQLDGSGSSDADGDLLSYFWAFNAVPMGSAASLTNPMLVDPSFAIDLPGTYVVQLTVNDGSVDSDPDEVVISTQNSRPVADAGLDTSVTVGESVQLDGSGSNDVDSDPLSFFWSLVAVPNDSTAEVSDPAIVNPTFIADQPGVYIGQLIVNDGSLDSDPDNVVVTADNNPPLANPDSITVVEGGSVQLLDTGASSVLANDSDPDGDNLTATLIISPTHAADFTFNTDGSFSYTHDGSANFIDSFTYSISDGKGGKAMAQVDIQVASAVLTGVVLSPQGLRFSALGDQRPLQLLGLFNNNTQVDLTQAPEADYDSSNSFVATVDSSGVITARANGTTTITANYLEFSATTEVIVEDNVTLLTLQVDPSQVTLYTLGATRQLMVTGTFSDGSTRDLTSSSQGTDYQSSPLGIIDVSGEGIITALARGSAVLTVSNEDLQAQVQVEVAVSSGSGFVRGEAYDDTRGLLLPDVSVELLADGSGTLATPLATTTDGRGQFLFQAQEGDALVRLSRPGYTSVERKGSIPLQSGLTLLDARLTPLDARSRVPSATGGTAQNTAGTARLIIAPGSLASDTDIRLTTISAQGLQGRLPPGWSPLATVDIQPDGLNLGQAAELRLKNVFNLAPGTTLTAAFYDDQAHAWRNMNAAQVSTDGSDLVLSLATTGQVALLLPDTLPVAPPAPVVGALLPGTATTTLPPSITVMGQVVPASAPPGENVRALGSLTLEAGAPLSSGTALTVNVSEQFDLLDGSKVVTQPFSQDIIFYGRPQQSDAQALRANFAISPSLDYTLQELQLGKVRLAVGLPGASAAGQVIGAAGGALSDAAGNTQLDIPGGALPADNLADLISLNANDLPVELPEGANVFGAVEINFSGAALSQPATLSAARPANLTDDAQVLIGRIFLDTQSIPRIKIVASGEVQPTRIVGRTDLGAVTLSGIREGGLYFFIEVPMPLGLIRGTVSDDTDPRSQVLVTADSALFADLTASDGTYLIAGAVGQATTASAFDASAGDEGSGTITLTIAGGVEQLDLTLAPVPPSVVTATPARDAIDVALDAPLTVTFSEAIFSDTLSSQSVRLELNGSVVSTTLTLSPDGRSLSIIPDQPLASASSYNLILTSQITDLDDIPLSAFAPLTFTTIDTSRPTPPAAGRIEAPLPDEEGIVTLNATQGTAEADSAVTLTNVSTRETLTVLAQTDGSFRLRLAAELGDELALTFRNANGQEVTQSITQFSSSDGAVGLGEAGGGARGPDGRLATILPNALSGGATLRIGPFNGLSGVFPSLPTGLSYVDQFSLNFTGGPLRRINSLTLREDNGRFQSLITKAPFQAIGSLLVPTDFLSNSELGFTATVQDEAGNSKSVSNATFIVNTPPDSAVQEIREATTFPSVFLSSPTQAQANQSIDFAAIAPTARIDLELPLPAGLNPNASLLLVSLTSFQGQPRLVIRDRLQAVDANGTTVLRTVGRDFPGVTVSGSLAVIASTSPLVDLTGQITGPAATISLDGAPFIVETKDPNARFLLPVAAGQPFSLTFLDPQTGATLGAASGQAPASGRLDLGQPLDDTLGTLSVDAFPNADAVADIDTAVVFTFSEPIDENTVNASTLLITDELGRRIFGTFEVSPEGTVVRFTPQRRWRYGQTYTYRVSPELLALSGARLSSAFSDQLTTFTPKLLTTVPIATTRDVAVFDDLALVGGEGGFSLWDLTVADQPSLLSEVSGQAEGRVSGVQILSQANLFDREAQPVSGTLGLVVLGTQDTVGRLQLFDLNDRANPALLGSAQLTVSSGSQAPLDAPGIPRSVRLGNGGEALVAVEGIGLETVDIADILPEDSDFPGVALGPRYPANDFADMQEAVALGDRIVAVGEAGLTVLDGSTLAALGTFDTTGSAAGVDGLIDFGLDIGGDGIIDTETEVFDLAVVANGADGTLQLFNVENPGAIKRIGVVRFPHPINRVKLNRDERLAYVSCGVNGVAVVDLEGPSIVQLLDQNLDGVDDRILGQIATGGTAQRLALDLDRGVAYLANGVSGLSVLQALPSRVGFQEVVRDPALAVLGEETSILETGVAFLTDEGLRVTVAATIPPRESLSLSIQEVAAGGNGVLRFSNGATTMALQSGTNVFDLVLVSDPAVIGSLADLIIRDSRGSEVDRFTLTLTAPDPGADAVLESLTLAPQPLVIGAQDTEAQLAVVGFYSTGSALNLTSAAVGTSYLIENPDVATVDVNERVTPVAGGTTEVFVSNGEVSAFGQIQVDQAPALLALEPSPAFITLTANGAQQRLSINGQFSDGSSQNITQGFGLNYSSADDTLVSVDANGLLTAVNEGVTTITVSDGSLSTTISVTVTFRQTPALTGIDLFPLDQPIRANADSTLAQAAVTGSGSLEGLTVNFSVNGLGSAQVTGVTDYSGIVAVRLDSFQAAGSGTVTASVIDPTSGVTLTDVESLVVNLALGDNEPNNDPANAVLIPGLDDFEGITGNVGGADSSDNYQFSTSLGGAVTAGVNLAEGVDPATVEAVILDENGNEINRFNLTGQNNAISFNTGAGNYTFALENGGAAADYSLTFDFAQGAVQITDVAPLSGSVGATVTVTGSGFSTELAENLVLFGGGVAGKVIASTETEIQVQVPANAIDGSLNVLVRSASASGSFFTTGNAGPPVPATLSPADPAKLRRDPISGVELDVSRLRVYFDPLVTRAQVETFAAGLGGSIVGCFPTFNTYVLEFSTLDQIDDLESLKAQIEADPNVLFAARSARVKTSSLVKHIDTRDRAFLFNGSTSSAAAYDLISLFEAVRAVRATADFDELNELNSVKIAILDTGFDPQIASKFNDTMGDSLVRFFEVMPNPNNQSVNMFMETQTLNDPAGHGTEVTGVIGAVNNRSGPLSGVLGSLYQPGEDPKFEILVYNVTDASGNIQENDVHAALADIQRHNVDIVNLSLGTDYSANGGFSFLTESQDSYRLSLAPYQPSALVVTAAGDAGFDTQFRTPASLAANQLHVVSVGGVAVANGDMTGERFDERARGLNGSGSNFGNSVTLAAPSEDVLVTTASGGGYNLGNGTSFAAGMVSGVAGILLTIDPSLNPGALRDILVDTADDISSSWDRGNMGRINALAAVRAVLPDPNNRDYVYIADFEADDDINDNIPPGKLIALPVDPQTGDLDRANAREIELKLTDQNGNDIYYQKPTSLAVSPTGDVVYAIVQSVQGAMPFLGDGLLVIDTQKLEAVDFIPIGGFFSSNRAGLAFSPDGKLLYVGTGSPQSPITIINTLQRQRVASYRGLPYPYYLTEYPINSLISRMQDLGDKFRDGILVTDSATGQARRIRQLAINGLSVAPNGEILYAAVESGGGGGIQPGAFLAIDVDLYNDKDANTPALQTDLDDYFTFAFSQNNPFVLMDGAGSNRGGDEPKSIAVSADSEYVYLVHGGVNQFRGISPQELDPSLYIAAVSNSLGQAGIFGLSGGLGGVALALGGAGEFQLNLFRRAQNELAELLNSGETLISSVGDTGVFSGDRPLFSLPRQRWSFPANLVSSWSPSPNNGGLIINQRRFGSIFSSRPFDMSIRHDGQRALVGYFQTGNFGVLDLDAQTRFLTVPPNPPGPDQAFAAADRRLFQGVVGVTQALDLDRHLWPSRGVLRAFPPNQTGDPTLITVQSPDEALLFTWDVEYAQNGFWAAATHSGAGSPRTTEVLLPDFENDFLGARLPLLELGFTYAGGSSITDPEGTIVSIGQQYQFKRGGGGLSIIDDRAIQNDFNQHLEDTVFPIEEGHTDMRAYYSAIPICRTVSQTPQGDPLSRCDQSVVSSFLGYGTAQNPANRFYRPRGLAIQPFITFDTPKFGDIIHPGQSVQVKWQEPGVSLIEFSFYEVFPVNGTASFRGRTIIRLNQAQLDAQAFNEGFDALFRQAVGRRPQNGLIYRIEAVVSGAGEISRESVDVTFNDATPPLPGIIDGPDSLTINTKIDRINGIACPGSALFRFSLTAEAAVTLTIDGNNVQDPLFNGNTIPAGIYEVLLTSAQAGQPGSNRYELVGSNLPDFPGVQIRDEGEIIHEVEINGNFPVGHTMIKGVDIWDGHLTHSSRDVFIPGRGLSLDFSRSYNSAGDSSQGPLGAGWTHSYNIRLEADNCGRFVIKGGEGTGNAFTGTGTPDSLPSTDPVRAALFGLDPDVVFFEPQIGYHSTLVQDPDTPSQFDFYTKSHVRYHFDREPALAGNVYLLQYIEEPNGNRITLTYDNGITNDPQGDDDPTTLDQVTDSSGRSLIFTYDLIRNEKRITSVRGYHPQAGGSGDLLGLEIVYNYDDGFGNLTSVTRKSTPQSQQDWNDERTEIYTYTPDVSRFGHNMLSYTDPNGHTTFYDYYTPQDTFSGIGVFDLDLQGILTFGLEPHEIIRSVREPEGVTTEFLQYDFATGMREISDPRPNVPPTRYFLNDYGATIRIEEPLGKVTVMEWCTDAPHPRCLDRNGNPTRDALVVRKVDPLGREHEYEYADGLGNLTRETIREFSTSFAGDNYAPVTESDGTTAVNEVTTLYEYDEVFNKLIRRTDAEGNVTLYEIDSNDPDVPFICGGGNGFTGNLLGILDAEGNMTCLQYAPNGDLRRVTDPRTFSTDYQRYDRYGNIEVVRDPLGNVTRSRYDERSRLLEMTDTFTRHLRHAYDGLDRKIRQERLDDRGENGSAEIMDYRYFPNGEAALITDGLGQTTQYLYDDLNRLRFTLELDIPDPISGENFLQMEYQYDEGSNIVLETDYRGVSQIHSYDELNRRTRTTIDGSFSGPNNPQDLLVTYTYDLVDNKLSETDLYGYETLYDYDWLYRMTRARLPFTHSFTDVPSSNAAVITNAYDRMGNKVGQTDANGQPITYVYDQIYRLERKIDADGNITTYAYDPASNKIREESLSTGLLTVWQPYDGLNRPTIVDQTVPLGGPNLSSTVYTESYLYEDSNNAMVKTNRRGFKVRIDKDGLDRVFQTIVDVDNLGLTTTYTYDANGNVATVEDPQGGDIDRRYFYDGLNRRIRTEYVSTPSDLGGIIAEEFEYDGNSNLIRVVDRRDIEFENTYDNLNRPLVTTMRERFSNGNAPLTLMEYQYTDEPINGLYKITETDANGNHTEKFYDSLSRLTIVDDPDPTSNGVSGDALHIYEYDGVNLRVAIDKKGHRNDYTYDAVNRQINVQEQDLNGLLRTTLQNDYLDQQNRVVRRDRRGITTIEQLDALGRLVQLSRSDGSLPASPTEALSDNYNSATVVLETHQYDGNNNRTVFIDGVNNRTEYTYDGADRQVRVTEGVGSAVEAFTDYTYDNVSNVLTVKDGRNHGGAFDVRNRYDARYRLIQVENNESAVGGGFETTRFEYDPNNNLTAVTEPKGPDFRTTYTYDELNALLSVDDTARQDVQTTAGVTRFLYDGNRNKIAQQDANGNLMTYSYDGLDRLINSFQHTVQGNLSATSRRGSQLGNEGSALRWQYGYDVNSNQNLIIDALGQRVNMTHDYLDRVETKTYSAHAEAGIDFQMLSCDYDYDGNSNMTQVTEVKQLNGQPGNQITETTVGIYDRLDRLQIKIHSDYDDPVGKQIEYNYDIQGNRLAVVDADGLQTDYTYDERNRLDTVITEAGTTDYDWWEDNLLQQVVYANGTRCDRSDPAAYDRADRLLLNVNRPSVSDPDQTPFSTYAYTYDDNGNRETQGETHRFLPLAAPNTTETTSYAYDRQNRLRRVTYGSSGEINYTYQPNGNRLTEMGTDPVTGQPINRTYLYERLSDRPATTYSNVNALTRIIDNNDATQNVTYEYDRNLNQIAKEKAGVINRYRFGIRDQILEATRNGLSIAQYDYNHQRLRIKKRTGPGEELRYLYDQTSVLQEYVRGADPDIPLPTTIKYNYGYELLSLTEVNPNGSLSPADRVNQFYLKDGLMSTVTLTDEAGAHRHSYRYDAWGRIRDQLGASANPRQYTGHYKDPETGLHYFGARYYDEEIGRFLSQDPYLGESNNPPSLHRYLYAYANPLRYVDLTGYSSERPSSQAAGSRDENWYDSIVESVDYAAGYWRRKIDNMEVDSTTGVIVQTVLASTVDITQGAIHSPVVLGEEIGNFAGKIVYGEDVGEEVTLEDIPILGQMGKALGETTAAAVENPNAVTISQAVGAWSGAFLTVTGGVRTTGKIRTKLENYTPGNLKVTRAIKKVEAQSLKQKPKVVKENVKSAGSARGETLSTNAKESAAIARAKQTGSLREKARILKEAGFNKARRNEMIRSGQVCFAAGTQVVTREGLKNIEAMQAGDSVLAKNEETGEQQWKRVVAAFSNTKDTLYDITIAVDGEADFTFTATGEHPFWIEGKGWVATEDLQVGDRVVHSNGSTSIISGSVSYRGPPGQYYSVYNIEVEDFHNYFVLPEGKFDLEDAVWTHNAKCEPTTSSPLAGAPSKRTGPAVSRDPNGRFHDSRGRFVRNPGSPEVLEGTRNFNRGSRNFTLEQGNASSGWKHIWDRHVDPTRFRGKSKFDFDASESDIVNLLSQTLKHGKEGVYDGLAVFTKRIRYKGVSKSYRVTVNTDGSVRTFHPLD